MANFLCPKKFGLKYCANFPPVLPFWNQSHALIDPNFRLVKRYKLKLNIFLMG